jgi:hypothetical protein
MRKLLVIVFALLGSSSRQPATAAALTPSQEVRTMTGSYNCVTHDGHQTWRFHSANTAWGEWLHVVATFAPQNGAPADDARVYVGFDRDAKQWNIISIDGSGSYYTRRSSSPNLNNSQWIDAYPADGARATLTISSLRQYTFDLTTPHGTKPSTLSHTVCTRATG